MAVVAFVGGMILFIGISMVFEYVSVQNALSFALKNGIYQSSKIAMVPELICELVENPEYVPSEPGDDEDFLKYIEVCEEIYKTETEYFSMLIEAVESYRQGSLPLNLELMAYESKPFLARAKLSGRMRSVFWNTEITVEEMVIAH